MSIDSLPIPLSINAQARISRSHFRFLGPTTNRPSRLCPDARHCKSGVAGACARGTTGGQLGGGSRASIGATGTVRPRGTRRGCAVQADSRCRMCRLNSCSPPCAARTLGARLHGQGARSCAAAHAPTGSAFDRNRPQFSHHRPEFDQLRTISDACLFDLGPNLDARVMLNQESCAAFRGPRGQRSLPPNTQPVPAAPVLRRSRFSTRSSARRCPSP